MTVTSGGSTLEVRSRRSTPARSVAPALGVGAGQGLVNFPHGPVSSRIVVGQEIAREDDGRLGLRQDDPAAGSIEIEITGRHDPPWRIQHVSRSWPKRRRSDARTAGPTTAEHQRDHDQGAAAIRHSPRPGPRDGAGGDVDALAGRRGRVAAPGSAGTWIRTGTVGRAGRRRIGRVARTGDLVLGSWQGPPGRVGSVVGFAGFGPIAPVASSARSADCSAHLDIARHLGKLERP